MLSGLMSFYANTSWIALIYCIACHACHACFKHVNCNLKLPSLFAAWHFWTFHTKSHNMKVLVILSHSWSAFLPPTCLYGKKRTFVDRCAAFWSIFAREKNPLRIPMQITWPWPPVGSFSHGPINVRQKKYMPISPHDIGYKKIWYILLM